MLKTDFSSRNSAAKLSKNTAKNDHKQSKLTDWYIIRQSDWDR